MSAHTAVDRLAILAIAAMTCLPLAGCTTNPATGRSQFNALSRSEEIAIGTEATPQLIQQYGGEVPDRYLQQYVSDIGIVMAQHTEADFPQMPWEFHFLNSPVINAFALPGGKVFVTRGLVQEMENEAELAGVIGHEIGHVTAQHADERIGRQMILAGVAIGASVAAGSQSDNDLIRYGLPALVSGAGVFALTYDRGEELEADSLGMRYMAKAGYNPYGQLEVMEILAAASKGGAQPELLSTHPHPNTRIKKIKKRLAEGGELAYTQNNAEYRFYKDRFQENFLSRLDSLPPMRQASAIEHTTPAQAITCSCGGCWRSMLETESLAAAD